MDIKEKTEMLERNLARQLDWIRAADSKVAPITFIASSMLGAAAAALSRAAAPEPLTLALAALTVAALTGALIFTALANFPRFSPDTGSIIFFEAIDRAGLAAFEQKAREVGEEEYFRDLSAMCYNSAHIARLKFANIKRAMLFVFSAILPWTLLVYDIFRSYNLSALAK